MAGCVNSHHENGWDKKRYGIMVKMKYASWYGLVSDLLNSSCYVRFYFIKLMFQQIRTQLSFDRNEIWDYTNMHNKAYNKEL